MRRTTCARTRAAMLAMTVLLVGSGIAGCSEDQNPAEGSGAGGSAETTKGDGDSTSETPEAAEHNRADVQFATDMIPHHWQALDMAELAPDRAGSTEVRELAGKIAGAQEPEIELMSRWLKRWDEPVPGTEMGGHAGNGQMPGMMAEEEMAELREADGPEFDRMFVTMMIDHHRGAVEMAETTLDRGEDPAVAELATDICDAQIAEIKRMRALLR